MVFEEYNNTLCVDQDVFLDLNLLTYAQFQHWCSKTRKKLIRLRTKGNGRKGLIKWDSIPEELRTQIKSAFGDPYCRDDVQTYLSRLENDNEAAIFFQKAQLEKSKELQHYTEAIVLNLYGKLLQEIETKARRNSSFKKTAAKKQLARVIADLKTIKIADSSQLRYPHKLPSNPRSLERKYKAYEEHGYASLPFGGDGKNAQKIKGPIADFLLAYYSLPNKPTTFDTWTAYQAERETKKSWPSISEDGIYAWLQETEQKKLWTYARHGRDEYVKQFGHKVTRDKSDWFPNVYMAIDGTKLDWIHYKEGAAYSMGADITINVVFDVYSERIIGFDYTTGVEDHTSHFKTWKMAMAETQTKPALLTYDGQSAHKSAVMQELYGRLVTANGGEHYKHRAYEHGSPVELLFKNFQKQILNKKWFSDKQAITVRTADSRPNMEFIKKFRHKLKTIEDLEVHFQQCVKDWNQSTHSQFECTREEASQHPAEFELDKVGMLEMMHLFWITSKDSIKYRREGIRITIAKKYYHYEVYDADGHVDLDFRDKYTNCQFHLQYDPNQMDNYVRLYLTLPNGDTKYIADAQPVKKIKSITALMDDKDKGRRHKMLKTRDKELDRVEQKLEALRNRTNITEESLITAQEREFHLKQGGRAPKEHRQLAETTSFADKL